MHCATNFHRRGLNEPQYLDYHHRRRRRHRRPDLHLQPRLGTPGTDPAGGKLFGGVVVRAGSDGPGPLVVVRAGSDGSGFFIVGRADPYGSGLVFV